MKKLFLAFVPLSLAMCMLPAIWNVKKEKVRITFEVPKHNKRGTINGLDAALLFDPADLANSKIAVKVNVKSLDANNWGLTQHLLSGDYFDVSKFPFITFTSSSISKTDSGFVASGNLIIKDKARPVTVPFKFIESDTASMFLGKMTIFCGDFGLIHNKEKDSTTLTNITIEVPVSK